jgi:hypothetical protein
VQNDSQESNESWEKWFRQEIHPRSIQWFSHEAFPYWAANRDRQINMMTIENNWKQYLKNSGSMLEYFQLELSYLSMVRVEQIEGFSYDYICRARTDTLYAKPLDFHWLAWNEEEVASRMKIVEKEMKLSAIEETDENKLKWFMCTVMGDEGIVANMDRIFADYQPYDGENILNGGLNAAKLRDYLHRGRYILTIRKNNLYVIRRDLFYMIPALGNFYGSLRSNNSDAWWYNAEGQFRAACFYCGITVFDYSTLYEEYSLEPASQWDRAKFFDLEGNLINPNMLYCVVRK